MSAFNKFNKKRKGFTVTELIIVVAIIGILLAVAVPSIIAYYRELRLVELDDNARTIFLAAQNRLSAMLIADKEGIPKGTDGGECDYNGSTGVLDPSILNQTVTFNYLTSKDPEMATIVLAGSVETEIHKNNYIVEYDPASGVVHAVWYWEGAYERFGSAYKADYNYVNDAAKSSRINYPVGYYGGGDVDRAKVGQMTIPELTLINAEELKLEIKIPEIKMTGVSEHIRVNVAINGTTIVEGAELLDDGSVGTVVLDTLKYKTGTTGTVDPFYPQKWSDDGGTRTGWTVGNKFKDWVNNVGVAATPGDDITVSVTVYMNGEVGGQLLLPQTASVKTNSLFEKVDGDTAYIAYGRHLQNLHNSTSGGAYCSGVKADITKAVQTKDINFWLSNTNTIQSWHDTYGTYGMNFYPVGNYNITEYDGSHGGQRYEIRNIDVGPSDDGFDGLFSTTAVGMSLENITMVNPTVHCGKSNGSAGALAGFSTNAKVSGCRVYNEYTSGKDPDSVQKLLDLADTDKLDKIIIEGVVGSKSVPLIQGMPHVEAPENKAIAGGLIASANGSIDISNSFASIVVVGEGYVGGLVGNAGAGDITIDSSYSGSFLLGDFNAGGLIGLVGDSNVVNIENSYATGEIVNGFKGGRLGFIGAGLFHREAIGAGTNNVKNCYAAVRYVDADGEPKEEGGKTFGTVLGTFGNDYSTNKNYYVKQSGIIYGYTNPNDLSESKPNGIETSDLSDLEKMLTDHGFDATSWNVGTDVTNTLADTHAYRLLDATKDLGTTEAYPYPMLKIGGEVVPQYGDWLEADDAQAAFVYFEKYNDDTYGFEGYTCVAGGTPVPFDKKPLQTDRNDDFYAVSDGYGLLVQREDKDTQTAAPTNVTVDGTAELFDNPTTDVFPAALTVMDGTDEFVYDLYILNGYTATPGAYYKTVSVGDVEYYFNPDFAREVIAPAGTTPAPAAPAGPQSRNATSGDVDNTSGSTNGVVIRTARQLANMSTYTNDASAVAQKWSFIQTLNVDFLEYDLADFPGKLTGVVTPADGTLPAYTTFTGITPFVPAKLATGGSYTGNEYNIRYLYLFNSGSNPNQGLFGVVDGGTLSGIRLLNVKAYTGNNTSRSGALVGYLQSGTVDNCGVYVENKHENTKYTNYNGVDVVINQHYYRLFAVATNTADAGVGGLIGEMDGGNVKNSFASVKVYAMAGYAGGFAGKINGGTITDCYSGGKTLGGVYRGISEADGTDASNIGTNSGYAGGFAGSIGSGAKFEGINYSTCSVRGNNDTLGQIGMFAGGTADAHSFDGSIAYATGTAFKNIDSPTTNADGSQERYTPVYYSQIHDETDYLLVGNTAPYGDATQGTKLEATDTFPYDLAALDGQAFPFATHNDEHHGDWIQAVMFTYIEIYSDDTYGVYSAKAGSTSEAIINTLDPKKVVKSDFYRILNLGDISGKRFEINDVEDTTGLRLDTTEYTPTFKDGKIEVEGKEYYVFELADINPTTNTAPSGYYNKLEIGNNTYYYNPYFACEAFEATAGTSVPTGQFAKPGAEGQGTSTSYSGVVIRSARQLVYLSKYTTGWKQDTANTIYNQARAWNYDQLLDIDYVIYENEYNGVSADSENGGSVTYTGGYTDGERQRPAILTTGSYNGHDKYIKNLYIGSAESDVTADTQLGSGLFGSVSGSVSHVNLINVSVDGGSSFATGGLAGVLQTGGEVDTCGIYLDKTSVNANYGTLTVTGASDNGVGGLIGQINGEVKDSFAAVKVIGTAAAATPEVNPVGGFVGQFNSGSVSNCYAGGYVGETSKTYDSASVNVSGHNRVGGFAGSIYGSAVFATDSISYSTASVGGEGSVGLFAGSAESFTNNSTLYAVAKAFDATTLGAVTAPRDETAYLSNPGTVRTTGFNTDHYNRGTDIFPYETNLDVHHGDWIDPVMGAYYDTVGGATGHGTTGYYANGGSISGLTELFVGTPGDKNYATDDGYAFLSTTDLGELAIGVNGMNYPLEKETVSLNTGDVTYIRRYKVPEGALNAVTEHYYTNVSVNGQFFTANFAFAGEIFDDKTDDSALDTVQAKSGMNYNDNDGLSEKTLGTTYSGTVIRTARQLANLGVRSNDGTYVDGKLVYTAGAAVIQELWHHQLLDIDFESYPAGKLPTVTVLDGSNASSNHMPITMMDGGYYGHEYVIKKLVPGMIDQATYDAGGDISEVLVESGLFGRVTGGELKGIRLVNTTVDGDASAYTSGGGSGPTGSEPIVFEASGLTPEDNFYNEKTCGTGNNFTLLPKATSGNSSSIKTETPPRSWKNASGTEVYTGSSYLQTGATSSTSKASIKFNVTGAATVKVWWVPGDSDNARQMRLIKDSGNSSYKKTNISSLDKDTSYFSVFTINETGSHTYYLGSESSSVKIYRVEVYGSIITYDESDPTPYTTTSSGGTSGGTTGTHFPSVASSKFKVRFGTLAGAVNPTDRVTIDNCGAYVEADSTHTTEDAAYNAYTVTNKGANDTTGGLIGMATKGANVTNSFAAVKVTGVDYVGGFAGHLKNMTVQNSYAGGHTVNSHYDTTNYNVTATNGAAGGFAGRLEETSDGDLKIRGIVYTTASASGKNEGQFAGAVTNGWKGYADPDGSNPANIYGIGDTDSSTGKTVTDESDYLNNFVVTVKDTSRTITAYPYDTMLQGKNYPYDTPATQTEHHGDWTVRVNFIYYEVYEGSTDTGANAPVPISGFNGKLTNYSGVGDLTVGFYGVLNDGTPDGDLVNTLSTTGYVVDSGYMILTEDDELTDLEFSINSRYKDTDHINRQSFTASDRITLATAMGSSSTTFTRAKYGFVIDHDTVKIAPADTFYMPVTVNGQAYMINPHFACEVVNVGYLGKDNKPDYDNVRTKLGMSYREIVYNNAGSITSNDVVTEDIDGLIIRSPFNFASMARYTRYGNTSTYRDKARELNYSMLMDVDYKQYIGNVIYDGYDSNRSDTGNKDANGDTLYNYHSGSGYAYGQASAMLVGSTFDGHGHTLSNLYLTNDSNYNFYVGIFSGLDNATVQNLKVDGLHMTTGTPAKDNGSGKNFDDDEKLIFIGGVAAKVFNGSVVKNVGVSNVEIDLHKTPTYNKDSSKKYFEYTDSTNTAPVRAVGGVVGALIDGTVENVTVDGIDIDLTGKTHYYTLPHDSAQTLVKEKSSGTDDEKSRPIVDDTKAVYVGGAIGEIDTNLTPMAAETVGATGAIGKAAVTNVYVTGAEISANRGDGDIVGGLVGRADGKDDSVTYNAADRDKIEISSSGVYLTDAVVTDALTGAITADNFNTKYGVIADSDSANVGGFVGRTDNYVSVDNCFSAIRVKGAGNVGGFAGDIEGSVIESCFSGGHTVGGLYDTTADAVANVTGLKANTVGGFAGKLENSGSLELHGTIYSTSSVANNDATTVSVGRFQGGDTNKNAVKNAVDTYGATVYAVGKTANVDPANVVDESEYLLTGAKLPANTNTTFVTKYYDPELKDDVYPYANSTSINTRGNNADLVPAHYGDWEEYAVDGAFYWELEDSVYHFYTVMYDGESVTPESDLCPDRHEDGHGITDWGYGVFSGKGTIALTNLTEEDLTDANANGAMEAIKNKYASAKNVTMIAGATAKSDKGTATVTVSGATTSVFTINPAYAAAITEANQGAAAMGTTGNTYKIRHVQQLDNIGDSEDTWFEQTHDVNGDGYTTYTPNSLKGGKYEGGSYRILDLDITATGSDDAALFSALENRAEIDHTILYATDGKGAISGTNAAGIAASMNGGSIENTIVAGYTITGNTVGGLAAKTEGTVNIENSEATVRRQVNATGGYIGGLVGQVTSGTTTINRSYAGGDVVTADGVTLNSDMTYLGGIVGGKETSASVVYDTVYSYVAMVKGTGDDELNFSEEKEAGSQYKFKFVTFHGIGPDVDDTATSTIGYWSGGMPDRNVDDRELSMSLLDLRKMGESEGFVAKEIYVPDAANRDISLKNRHTLNDGDEGYDKDYHDFPFSAFVMGVTDNIHYGAWPEAQKYAGLFYWEKEIVKTKDDPDNEDPVYHFYAYGTEFVRGKLIESELVDTLCYSHHVDERASIVATGYGYFVPKDVTFSETTNFVDKDGASAAGIKDFDKIQSGLFNSFRFSEEIVKNEEYKVYLYTGNPTKFDDVKDTVWTITCGTESFGMKVAPMFGAAIYGDDFIFGTGDDDHVEDDNPFVARTVEQFNNMMSNSDNGSLDHFAITHDIDFEGVDYKPSAFNSTVLNGMGYRLIDVNISVESGNAALFTTCTGGTNALIKNIILYSPGYNATIETKNGMAAGIIADLKKSHLANCVVSGYKIKGTTTVGGVVGTASSDSPIYNCQAYVTLDGSGSATLMGGIVGKAEGKYWSQNGDKFKSTLGFIKDCYSGGEIIKASNSANVGGIFGTGNYSGDLVKDKKSNYYNDELPADKQMKAEVSDCYTYMDLTDTGAKDANVYPVGKVQNIAGYDGDNCYYFADNYNGSNGTQATAVNFGGLAALAKGSEAEYSYWPKDEAGYYGYVANAMGTFPFRTVATYTEDGEKINVHYGKWPEGAQAAGVAYYELDSDGNYSFQIVGIHPNGTGGYEKYTSYDDLCNEYHVNSSGDIEMGHQIVKSGYLAFTTKPGTMTVGDSCELKGLGTPETDSDIIDEVSLALGSAIGGAIPEDGIKVYPTVDLDINEDNYSDYSWTPSVQVKADTTTVDAYYTNGFAGVSDSEMGTAATNSIQIRTVQQLDNIPSQIRVGSDNVVSTSGKYFEQTHDLYGENYTADGTNSGDPKYIGAVDFAGTYNGKSYRILELSMDAIVSTDTDVDKNVGLFRSASGTIENVILYSPSGNAHIKNSNRATVSASSHDYIGAGGIVGRTSAKDLTVSNCVVAGYTITGCDIVGGIVGYSYHGATISDCAAVNDLVGTEGVNTARGMGGITGAGDHSTTDYVLKITNCYAGGSIKSAGNDTHVGGIVGYDASGKTETVVTNSYTYVDLSNTGADKGNVNTIGLNLSASTNNYYLDESDLYPTGLAATNKQGDAKDYFDMTALKTADDTAAHAYAPSTSDGLKNTTYPFPAKVKNKGDSDSPVHYGKMPPHTPVTQAINGIFYWEKHGTDYHVQYIGKDESGDATNGGKLCEERDGTGIEESGFGYFAMGSASPTTPNAGTEIVDTGKLDGITEALKDNGVFDKVTVKAFETGAKVENSTWTVGTISAAVNQGFAKVYSAAEEPKQNGPAYEIRTIEQLSKINDLGSGSSNEVKNYMFTQTHDLMSNSTVNAAYTPAYLSTGSEYDGQGYRILELSISATGDYIGLFSRLKGTVKNVVLYSPSGNATISKGANVGGIAGQIGEDGSITNCVVAGYEITGTAYVGGIAGDMNKNATGISNSEAVNKLNGSGSAAIGGIAGRGSVKIENCYAGGEITGGSVSGSKLNKYIGGIYGNYNDSAPAVSNCYTYVDLNNVCSATDYNNRLCTIGYGYSGTDCYYLASKFPTTGTKVGVQGTALDSSTSLTGFATADRSYAPVAPSMTGGVTGEGLKPMTDSYPYPAVFTPDGTTHEHYGTWVGTSTTPGGDPGISEGPSFAPAILPKKFELPDPDDQEEPGGDDHTEYVTLRTRPATVRRVSK